MRWLPPRSAVYRLRNPDSWQWGLPEQILAGIFDGIQGGNWQRAGNKNAPRPKPMPRPGVGPKRAKRPVDDPAAVPVTDIRAEMERRRAQYAAVTADEPQIPEPVAVKSRRLSAGEVRSARIMADHGIDTVVIAAHLTVPVGTVERLLAGDTYRHIA